MFKTLITASLKKGEQLNLILSFFSLHKYLNGCAIFPYLDLAQDPTMLK